MTEALHWFWLHWEDVYLTKDRTVNGGLFPAKLNSYGPWVFAREICASQEGAQHEPWNSELWIKIHLKQTKQQGQECFLRNKPCTKAAPPPPFALCNVLTKTIIYKKSCQDRREEVEVLQQPNPECVVRCVRVVGFCGAFGPHNSKITFKLGTKDDRTAVIGCKRERWSTLNPRRGRKRQRGKVVERT